MCVTHFHQLEYTVSTQEFRTVQFDVDSVVDMLTMFKKIPDPGITGAFSTGELNKSMGTRANRSVFYTFTRSVSSLSSRIVRLENVLFVCQLG